jgi:hypothetical protein
VTIVLDREAAVSAWRRAEARIYPSVMVNADLYQQYIGVVHAVAEELRAATTERDLVTAWYEQREIAREVVARSAPPMLALMDLDAVRDAAFCHRHREVTREQGKELARERLDAARPHFELEVVQLDPRDGAWLVDRPPLMPATTCDNHEEWEARTAQARVTFGRS